MKDLLKIDTDAQRYLNRISMVLYFFTIISIVVTGFLNNDKIEDILKLLILSIILVSITLFYAKLNHFKLLESKLNSFMVMGAYLFSLLSSMISFQHKVYNLWMFGPILIALIIDINLGLSFHILFTFLLSITSSFSLDEIIINFLLGAMGCLLAKFIKELSKLGYVLIIFISCNITLVFLINNFVYENSMNIDLLYSLISSILVMAALYFTNSVYHKASENLNIEISDMKDMSSENFKIESSITNNSNAEKSSISREIAEDLIKLDNLMREEHPLNRRLKHFSPKLYMHSELMGEVCFSASKKINANAQLAGAGAFYYKIGHIVSKNYIEDGIKLLEENNAPQKVIDIVAQYHSQYGRPKSVEAAIVMLADSIISSIEILEKTPEKNPVSTNKLVDNIISFRLSKGNLDESGLTIVELKLLKEFFSEDLPIIMKQYEKEE